MKNKLNKILLITSTILVIVILILALFASINREGYLSNFQLNKDLSKKNAYYYDFRLKYYSKIFRNSDIFNVIFDVPKSSYVGGKSIELKDIKFDNKGSSPFGSFTSNRELKYDDKIYDIKYKLKLKIPILIVLIIALIYILYNYELVFHIFNNNKKTILKIYKMSPIFILFILVLLFIIGKINRKGSLEDLQLIANTKAGYVYKARVVSEGLFSDNILYDGNKAKFDNKPNYIKNYGFNLEFNNKPYGSSRNFTAFNDDVGFTVSNSSTHSGAYRYGIELFKGEKYIITLEAKKLSKTIGGVVKYNLNSGANIPIPNTDKMTDEYQQYISELNIKKDSISKSPAIRIAFPSGVINIKSIKIEQVSDNLNITSKNNIVFTSNQKIDDINSLGNIVYKLSLTNKVIKTAVVIILFIILSNIIIIYRKYILNFFSNYISYDKTYNISSFQNFYNKYNISNILFAVYLIFLSILVFAIGFKYNPNNDIFMASNDYNCFYNIFDFKGKFDSFFKVNFWQRGRQFADILTSLPMRPFGNMLVHIFNADPFFSLMLSNGLFTLIYTLFASFSVSIFIYILNNKKNFKIIFLTIFLFISNYTIITYIVNLASYVATLGLSLFIYFPIFYYFLYREKIILIKNHIYNYMLYIVLLYPATFTMEPTSIIISGISFFILLYFFISNNDILNKNNIFQKNGKVDINILLNLLIVIIFSTTAFLLTKNSGRGGRQRFSLLYEFINRFKDMQFIHKLVLAFGVMYIIYLLLKFIKNKKISKIDYICFSISFTSIFTIIFLFIVNTYKIWAPIILLFSLIVFNLVNNINRKNIFISGLSSIFIVLLIFNMTLALIRLYDNTCKNNKYVMRDWNIMIDIYKNADKNGLNEIIITEEDIKRLNLQRIITRHPKYTYLSNPNHSYNYFLSMWMNRYYVSRYIPIRVIRD